MIKFKRKKRNKISAVHNVVGNINIWQEIWKINSFIVIIHDFWVLFKQTECKFYILGSPQQLSIAKILKMIFV